MVKDLVSEMVVRSPWEPLARAVYGWVSPTARYDSQTLEVMDRIVRPNSNCIDIGCYQSYILREIVRRAPKGMHFAIESRPERFARLKAKYPQVTLLNVAASDPQDAAALDSDSTPSLSSFACISRSSRKNSAGTQVLAARLDDLIPDDLAVRFVNLHVNGSELPALRGARETIRRCHPYIIFDHSRLGADETRSLPEDLYDFLTLNGLAISQLDEWLIGNSPLARQEFCDQLERHTNSRFLAHP